MVRGSLARIRLVDGNDDSCMILIKLLLYLESVLIRYKFELTIKVFIRLSPINS